MAIQTYQLTSTFPKEERFGLISQMNGAGVSIPSNIAEGNSRSSDREKGRFIEIALGSCFELTTQALIADALQYGNESLRQNLLISLDTEGRMLQTFLQTLKRS